MGPSNVFSCETWSCSHHHIPHRSLSPTVVLSPKLPTLESWVLQSILLPHFLPGFSVHECGLPIWSTSHCPAWSSCCHLAVLSLPLCPSPPLLLLVECLFNSLVVGLLWKSYFSHSGCSLLLNSLLFVFLLLVLQGSEVFLPTPSSWPLPKLLTFLILPTILMSMAPFLSLYQRWGNNHREVKNLPMVTQSWQVAALAIQPRWCRTIVS